MPLSPKGFPVMLTFDLDAETMWTSRDPANADRPIILSQGAYGWKTGLGRVLDLLDIETDLLERWQGEPHRGM